MIDLSHRRAACLHQPQANIAKPHKAVDMFHVGCAVYKPGVPTPRPTHKPKPKPTMSFAATIKSQSGIYYPSFACHSDIGGATRCGIPVGYTNNNRTGAIWLPKVSSASLA